MPVALALAAAGVAGFLVAQWASRPAAVPIAAPPSTVAPLTLPTYAPAPYVSAAPPARASVPVSETVALPRTVPSPAPRGEPAPVQAEGPPVGTFALQAVTEQDGQPVAIVNGQLVRVGDVVEGARVLRITPETVEIEKDGRRIVLGF